MARSGDQGVRLWMHGHTHHAVDYRIGAVRIASNAFGYPKEGNGILLIQVIALEEPL